MNQTRYIFVHDQGHVFSSHRDPTSEDFGFASVGMVTIIRLSDGFYYGRDGKWQPIPAGALIRADMDGELSPPFHSLTPESEKKEVEESPPEVRRPRFRLPFSNRTRSVRPSVR